MKEFLRSVAEHYHREAGLEAGHGGGAGAPSPWPMAGWLFVFPNRRSGLFFNHYLSGLSDRPMLAPQVTTSADLFQRLATLRLADRTELLFRLYRLYRDVSRTQETFDQFVFWGDMLLSDFDDVDKYLVDARRLFTNVRDLKEIDELFADLPEEVMRVVRSFWAHVGVPQGGGEAGREVFQRTWSILYTLYDALRRDLAAAGMAYEGMMQREVVERLRAGDGAALPWSKVVFVGLTAISRADRELMLFLRRQGVAEFCWDYADPRLRLPHAVGDEAAADVASQAAYFTAENLSDFPNALSADELRAGIVSDAEREVRVFSVPSGVGQTAQARAQLLRWMADGHIDAASRDKRDEANAFHTAVVLPDEQLLIPMLYAVPAELEPFNVTMGYGLRSTPVAALVEGIARLQQDVRRGCFYYKSVLPLLAHNYTAALAGDAAREAAQRITHESLYLVAPDMLTSAPAAAAEAPAAGPDFMRLLFRPVATAAEAARQLQDVLDLLQDVAGQRFGDVDREFIIAYAQVVQRLGELIGAFGVPFSVKTFYLLLGRLAQGVTVPFTGEPLAGLQVMGVLETRAVDFSNLIVLSMNEGIFPARPSSNTFVPMSLRRAFGLPTQQHRDAVYAYHFYRLLSRARRVTLIYDARSGERQTGEPSRYLMQLRYLYGVHAEPEAVAYPVGVSETMPFEVAKTPEVMARLDRCRAAGSAPGDGVGTRQFSATALKAYLHCPLRFYLQFVERLDEEEEVTEGVDARQFGLVLHAALSRLYDTLRGGPVQSDVLHRMADDRDALAATVRQALRDEMNLAEVTGYLRVVCEIIVAYIQGILRHDARLCPFTYEASEAVRLFDFAVTDGLTVRLKCIYDRLDRSRDGHLRVVDYKTSSPDYKDVKNRTFKRTEFSSVDGLFDEWGRLASGDDKAFGSEDAFQVMLYCLMLTSPDARPEGGAAPMPVGPEGVQPHLYYVRAFHDAAVSTVLTQRDAGPVTDFAPYAADFADRLRRLLAEIYDPSVPFRQADAPGACRNCPFRSICKRD